MKKSDLIWAICDIDEDLLRLTEEESAMPKKHTRPLRVFLIAAVVAALLAGTVLAYAVRHWDELFVSVFQVEDSDKELLDGSLQDVYAQTTQDGVTCTVTQLLGTEHTLVVAVEIKLSEDLEIGTTSAEDLNALAKELELPEDPEEFGSLAQQLAQYFGYDMDRADFPDVPHTEDAALAPVIVEKADLLSEIDQAYEEYTSDTPECLRATTASTILIDHALDELRCGIGSETINSYDPETKTLKELFFLESDLSLQDRPYTLVIHHLYLQSMADLISRRPGFTGKDLLTSPIVLHFTADYQPQTQTYDILQDGASVGTLELSPISAHLTFPQEPDDPTRLAPNRHDYLKNNGQLCIRMKDGREIELTERTSGFTDVQFAFYRASDIIDLTQIQEVRLGSYTLAPLAGE